MYPIFPVLPSFKYVYVIWNDKSSDVTSIPTFKSNFEDENEGTIIHYTGCKAGFEVGIGLCSPIPTIAQL